MKKIFVTSLVVFALMSCGNDANDGDADTDTTNMDNTMGDTSMAPLGDTSMNMNNEGTLSNPGTRTDVDTAGTGTGTGTGTQGGGTGTQGTGTDTGIGTGTQGGGTTRP